MLSPGEIEDPQITSEQLLSLGSDFKIISMLEEISNKHCPAQFQDIEKGGKISKSNPKAQEIREEGHKLFKQKKYLKALLAYTECIATAENGSELLGLGYADRAMVLFEKGFYGECLKDIDRSLKTTATSPDLQNKLQEIKVQAEQNIDKQRSPKYHREIPSLTSQNSHIPCAADNVTIEDDPYSGRNVVATRNIEPGEIIAIENPYVIAIGTLPSQKYLHCHECAELCLSLIPCSGCRTALYCSEECLNKAKTTYHRFECDLFQFDFMENVNLKTTLKMLLQMDQTPDHTFETLKTLTTNKEQGSVRDLFEATNEACIFLYFLKKYSSLFSETKLDEDRLKETFFHNYFSTGCNKISVEKIGKKNIDTEFHTVGDAIYGFASMLNHQCYGNVCLAFYGATLVLRAARFIRAGETCSITYRNFNFAEYPKLVRADQLRRHYHFTCKCEACENNWPLFECLDNGDTEAYFKLVELVKKALEDDMKNYQAVLDHVKNIVKNSPLSEPSKVDVNTKRIFCDLLKLSGNNIINL